MRTLRRSPSSWPPSWWRVTLPRRASWRRSRPSSRRTPASVRGACSIRSKTEQTRHRGAMSSRRSGRPAGRPGGDALAALQLVNAARVDRKGIDPMVLDLRGLTAAAEFFVIVSGTSDRHVRGMAEHMTTALEPRGIVPHHVEGLVQGRCVVVVYVVFVLNVFHPAFREVYQH